MRSARRSTPPRSGSRRQRGRLIFPILDQSGAPRGFAGRLITGDGPKYLNTPETDLYQKRSLLYGIHLARQPIVDAREVVVVEGYTDAIAAHQVGFTNVVATGGTAMTPQHLETLAPITTTITLAFDGDQAGLLAAQRTAELDRAGQGIHLRVARLPTGQDPAELLADDRSDLLQEAIAGAVPLEHHLIDQIVRQHNLEEPESIARAIHAAGSVVSSWLTPPLKRRQSPTWQPAWAEIEPSSRGTSRTAPSLQRAVEADREEDSSPELGDHHA